MIGLLTIGLIGLALCKKKRSVSGIGAVKRRIYKEISELQRTYPRVDFTLDFDSLPKDQKDHIEWACENWYNKVYPKRKPLTAEKYYKQLRKAYGAISGVGTTSLPYRESIVKNNFGDTILIHRDYGTPEQKMRDAIIYIEESYIEPGNDDYKIGYWGTVLGIATGKRFIWKSSKNYRGIESLIFGASAPTEKKMRISYIATKEKGGISPERYAESLLEYSLNGDSQEILSGVLDAIREIHSVKQAKQIIYDTYLRDHIQQEEYDAHDDLPF